MVNVWGEMVAALIAGAPVVGETRYQIPLPGWQWEHRLNEVLSRVLVRPHVEEIEGTAGIGDLPAVEVLPVDAAEQPAVHPGPGHRLARGQNGRPVCRQIGLGAGARHLDGGDHDGVAGNVTRHVTVEQVDGVAGELPEATESTFP